MKNIKKGNWLIDYLGNNSMFFIFNKMISSFYTIHNASWINSIHFTEKGLDPRIFRFPKSFGNRHELEGDLYQISLYHLIL